jgi:hypothetical protein
MSLEVLPRIAEVPLKTFQARQQVGEIGHDLSICW